MALLLTKCFRQSALQQMALRSGWMYASDSLLDNLNILTHRWVFDCFWKINAFSKPELLI